MTKDYQIRDGKLQYNTNREAAKKSALSYINREAAKKWPLS